MRIFLASDHAGFEAKAAIAAYLKEQNHEVEDCGPATLDPTDDYPDFILPCARRVAEDKESLGIIFGASGEGEAMAANRVSGVRATVYYGAEAATQEDADGTKLGIIESARAHNNANILSLGARFLSIPQMQDATKRFLDTPFSNDPRHVRRLEEF